MRIQTKVFLTVLATSVVLIAVLMKSIQWSLDRELLAYVSARDRAVFEPVLAQLASPRFRQSTVREGPWER